MPIFDPELLSKWSSGEWKTRPKGTISGFNIDTRKINAGDVFVAVKADRDGHDFINDAKENGASASLVEEVQLNVELPQIVVKDTITAFHDIAHNHRLKFNGSVIGVTGSCGKTSTKDLLNVLLGSEQTFSTEGNLNNYLGVPLTLLNLDYNRHQFCVVEAGINRIGEMSLLGKTISPDIAIVTLISPSHLKGLIDLETIASEKAKLFLNSENETKVIFPEECLKYKEFNNLLNELNNLIVLRDGEPQVEFSEYEAFYSIWTETNKIGSPLSLRLWRYGLPSVSFSLPSMSDGMVKNTALAVLAALECGVSVQEISERLPQFRPSALRGKTFQGRGRSYVLDCYNANPASMKDAVDYFRSRFHEFPRLLVLGGMDELGSCEKEFHKEIGNKISSLEGDVFLLVGEKASWIANGLVEEGVEDKRIIVLSNLCDAIPIVEDFEGCVLFKGSRSYGLEKLLPSWAVPEDGLEAVLKC